LLRHPTAPDAEGRLHHITPHNAGWTYVGFDVHRLAPGASVTRLETARETCIVVLTGVVTITVGDQLFDKIGGRASVFEGNPWSVYAPPRQRLVVTSAAGAEVAFCTAPAIGRLPARLIPPDAVGQELRGKGTNVRHVRNILPDTAEAESLLVVEVVTPGGNWSSYPPHKHDADDFPNETALEETYYHRLARPGGFAVQRVYTDDRSLDETMAVGDGDVVLVPRGYHPVGAPHGFDLWYLNVMAGPRRAWKFTMAPEHAWLGW
ncbi:5-deoxy-glucuronate isomerase, partial [Roseomonas sp. 18066]|uniref:5-deoxy-glucuronate isomerase n=1 Tax=Roseomonas sp. 18066 TaxID=2681412 RepID=UPI0021039E58